MTEKRAMTRYAARVLVVVAAVFLVAACSSPEKAAVTSTTLTSTTTTEAPTTTSTSPTTTTTKPAPRTTTTSTPIPPAPEVEQLKPTPYTDPPLEWIRADVSFDRDREHWLGIIGNEYVMLSWGGRDPSFTIRTSSDGFAWSKPETVTGLPPGGEIHGIDGAGAGAIALVGVHDPCVDETPIGVYTTADGVSWIDHQTEAVTDQVDVIAGNDSGFAAIVGNDEGASGARLYLSLDDGSWEPVELGDHERHLGWVIGLGDGFVAQGPWERSHSADEGYSYYMIGSAEDVAVIGVPDEWEPLDWDGAMLIPEGHGEVTSMLVSPSPTEWYRLPFFPETERPIDYWSFETLSAGEAGIIGVGCECDWEFWGDNFAGIYVDVDGYQVNIDGDYVWVESAESLGLSTLDCTIDTADWFNTRNGTLTIPNPETGETFATVTCEQMRDAARSGHYQWIGTPFEGGTEGHGRLIGYPDNQELWHSPDGTSWHGRSVTNVFGEGAYVFQTSTLGDTLVAFVAPNGEKEIGDPPGCALGVFPEEEPYEIWVAQVP